MSDFIDKTIYRNDAFRHYIYQISNHHHIFFFCRLQNILLPNVSKLSPSTTNEKKSILKANSPSIAILSIDVAAELDEELDDLEVARADGIVKSGDALVVGRARIGHLLGRLLHELELALEARVEEQGERVEADPPREIRLARRGLEVALFAPDHVRRGLRAAQADGAEPEVRLDLDRV